MYRDNSLQTVNKTKKENKPETTKQARRQKQTSKYISKANNPAIHKPNYNQT